MKSIIELKSRIKDKDFFLSQFEQQADKRILFVNPSLSGKNLYKMLLPYLGLRMDNSFATAITNISDFSVTDQLLGYKAIDIINGEHSEIMIKWATHIVFPFSLQPLTEHYAHIREINPQCKVMYNVDFNFYELSDKHPLKSLFSDDMIIDFVEDNMYFSDVILTSNGQMQAYLIEKVTGLVQTKYQDIDRGSIHEMIGVKMIPFLSNEKTVLDNVEYDASEIIFKVPEPKEEEVVTPPVKNKKKPTTKPVVVSKEIKKRANKPVIKLEKVIKKSVKKKGKKKK